MPDEELEQLVLHRGSPELRAAYAREREMAASGETPSGSLADWMSTRAIRRRARRARDRLLLQALDHFHGPRLERAAALHDFIARLPAADFTRRNRRATWSPLRHLVHAAYQHHRVVHAGSMDWPPSQRLLRRLEPWR